MHLDINMHMYMYILELLGGYRQYGKVRDARGGRARDCVRTAYAYRHGRVELQLVVRLGLDSHHWLLVTEPTLEVRAVGGWHLLVQRYHLDGERHGRSCNRVASLATLQLLLCTVCHLVYRQRHSGLGRLGNDFWHK